MRRLLSVALAGLAAVGLPAADEFVLVRDGQSAVAIEVPAYPQGASDVAFFTNAVFRCTGAEMAIANDELRIANCGRIAFKVETRPIIEEDDWAIDFPDEKTLRITGTAMSCRWALNWILEERFGCCFCFPGKHGSHYPQATSVSLPREARKGTMSLKLQRDLWWEEPAWQRAMGGKAPAGNFMGHNLRSFLPPEKYAKDPWREKIMPEINGVRIVPKQAGASWNNCYASEESVTESVKNICAHLRAHPGQKVYALSVNDGSGHCECAGCKAMNGGELGRRSRFGGHSSLSEAYYTWVNRVAEGVAAEFPDVLLGLLAYRNTIDPPGFALRPNVVPFLCVDVSQLVEPKRIANRRELFAKWSACAKNFGLWDYAYGISYTPARVYLRTMDEFFKWRREFPAFGGVFAEGDTYAGEGPKRWWHYKLMANSEADRETALGTWYAACCGKSAAPTLRAYYDLLESHWTGEAIRKTPWFRNTNDNTYLNFSDQTHLHALPRDLMARAGELIREVVARARQDGDAGQRWRATMLMWYHEMYAARCLWGGAGRVRPDGSFGDVAEAADYVRALPEMCDACRRAIRLADRLEELRRVELGRPLPLIDRRRRDHYVGWGADVVYNPNFTMLMNRALAFRRRPEFTNALATAAGDARIFPDYAQTLRALADLSSATNCYPDGGPQRLTGTAAGTVETGRRAGDLKRGFYVFRTRVRNESSRRIRLTEVYHSASPTYTDLDSFGIRATASVAPGATEEVSAFCFVRQERANLGFRVLDLPQGESVVLEKIELLRLCASPSAEAVAESANPGRLDAALKASDDILAAERQERKIKAWAAATGLTVEAFKALDPPHRSLAMQAYSCDMKYADYLALSPAERRVRREEAANRRKTAQGGK